MGKHKTREYSSSDSEASSDSEPIEKSRKHKKSSKKSKKHKSKKKKRQHSSSNESNSEPDAWVERNVDKKPSPAPVAQKQRDDWMSADNFFIPTFAKEKKPTKSAAEKANLAIYDPATNSRELNPYYKTGEGGMPSGNNLSCFQRPKDSDDYDDYRSTSKRTAQSSSGSWRKSRQEKRRSSSSSSKSRSRSPVEKQRIILPARPEPHETGITASHSDFLTDQQMNEMGAKMIKAELLGNEALASKLKAKLEKAKAFKSSGKAPPSSAEKEKVVLSITNSAGTSRPATQRDDSIRRPHDKKKKNKRVDTHEDGERTKYYPDDGKYDIKQMVSVLSFCNHMNKLIQFVYFQFEREKFVDGKDQDIEFAKAISKVKDNEQMDMAEIFSDNIRKDKQKKTDERDDAIREHQKMEKILDSCNKCFDSPKMDKDLVVHVGKKIYIAIPYYEGLVNHHLVISPIQHVPCSTMVDEDVWDEFTDLKKALTQFFFNRKEDVVFFETVKYLHRRPHMEIHCVAHGDLEMVQFYFKKAIQESETSTLNKKLIELKADKNIRRSVPRSLSYFWVDFGSTGMAHVIENQETFPSNFAQEIIGGMMNLNVNRWRKPRKEQQPKKRIDYFNSLLKNVIQNM